MLAVRGNMTLTIRVKLQHSGERTRPNPPLTREDASGEDDSL